MKFKWSKQAIFQSFLFNIVFIILFSVLGVYYVLPLFTEVSEKKDKLDILWSKYIDLKKKWLDYANFTALHKTLWKEKKISDNVFLSNVLENFWKNDYEQYFLNTTNIGYSDFLDKQIKDARIKRQELEDTGISNSIKDILPYFTDNASLSDSSLTNFKFINRIESLLDTFDLNTVDNIWMWDLSIVGSIEQNKWSKENASSMDGKIYRWEIRLNIVWKKKNIVNFIHYIDNVWKIKIEDWKVTVKRPNKEAIFIDDYGNEKNNDFLDIPGYFIWEEDIYNRLIMEMSSLELAEYLDSSDLPTPDRYTFLGLVKEKQWDEKYKANLVIAYYVKGLPSYKITNFIQKTSQRYAQLLQISKVWKQFISKNKAKFKTSNSISAIDSLSVINKYLIGIEAKVGEIKEWLWKKGNIWEAYKTAREYDSIFNAISKSLDHDMKSISIVLYKKYKDILNNK